jgi:hypothetical protein
MKSVCSIQNTDDIKGLKMMKNILIEKEKCLALIKVFLIAAY